MNKITSSVLRSITSGVNLAWHGIRVQVPEITPASARFLLPHETSVLRNWASVFSERLRIFAWIRCPSLRCLWLPETAHYFFIRLPDTLLLSAHYLLIPWCPDVNLRLHSHILYAVAFVTVFFLIFSRWGVGPESRTFDPVHGKLQSWVNGRHPCRISLQPLLHTFLVAKFLIIMASLHCISVNQRNRSEPIWRRMVSERIKPEALMHWGLAPWLAKRGMIWAKSKQMGAATTIRSGKP